MKEPIYVCPACDSDRVTAEHIQTFMVYTGGTFPTVSKPTTLTHQPLVSRAGGRGSGKT